MTDNIDGPTLDLTTTRQLAEAAQAGFEEIAQVRQEAQEKLTAFLDGNPHLRVSLQDAYLHLAEEISADPALFGEVVGSFAKDIALEFKDMNSSAEGSA